MSEVAFSGDGLESLKAQKPPRMGLVVARALLGHILATGMQPGDRLPTEADLGKRLGVGKGSLREGLFLLEVTGFITVSPGAKGGARVTTTGASEFADLATMFFQQERATLRDLLDLFVTLEPLVARVASTRRDKGRLGPLRQLLDEAATVDPADDEASPAFVAKFHRTIARLSGNSVLDLFVESLITMWYTRVPNSVYQRTKARRKRIIEDHVQIARAILAGQAATAEQLMRDHMQDYAKYLQQRHADMLDQILEWR